MILTKMGGYRIDCHIVVELKIDRRPKSRKSTCGDALTSASTTPLNSPAGDMAGANAMKTLTLSLSFGWIASAAKACAVPCENPIYERLSCPVVSNMYAMLSGISCRANSSMEKFQKSILVGECLIDFLEYLFPRLFPSLEREGGSR